MLYETKKELTVQARRLTKPYESYSIDELADAYCEAVDNNDETLKNVYISALILRFWYTIDKMFKSNSVAPSLEYEDFFWWLYEAIEYACKYRGWQDTSKNLNAKQCINKCIETIKLQKYYDLRLDKRKSVNYCSSLNTPIGGADDSEKTLGDMLESDLKVEDNLDDDVVLFIQNYINNNKIIEAVILDTIAFNDVQKYFKKTIKTKTFSGEPLKYVEHSSEFWPYKLVQLLSKLPITTSYKNYFLKRYNITEAKFEAVANALDSANNQKIYRYVDHMLGELRITGFVG